MVKCNKSQAGFTLVELAIVMIIIGLLIGGVLKGQQLITNAQITSTVAQVKAIDAATTSFRDQFNGMAGDILTPENRIGNCPAAGNCGIDGNGDGKVNTIATPGSSLTFAAAPANTTEQLGYWAQLQAAGLLTGVNAPTAATGATGGWGGYAPASKIQGGGFDVGYNAGGATLQSATQGGLVEPAGEYLALHGTAAAAVGGTAGDSFLTPNQAARIDTKIDDGVPNSGTVWAAANTQANCTNGTIATSIYSEALTAAGCSLYIQFQN